MQELWWRGIDVAGSVHTGRSMAGGAEQLAAQLHVQGIALLVCKPAQRAWVQRLAGRPRAASAKNLGLLLYHVGTLVQRGVPLSSALETFAHYAPTRQLAGQVLAMRQQLAQGASCVQAFRDAGLISDQFLLALIDIGQQTESLGVVLCALASFIQTKVALLAELRQALYVPVLTVACALAVVTLVVAWVVPSCSAMLQTTGNQLPIATEWLLAIASPAGLAVVVGVCSILPLAYIGVRMLAKGSVLEKRMAYWGLQIPVFGRLVRVTQLWWWTAACGLGLRVGMPLVTAYQGANQMLSNAWLRDAFTRALEDMQRGVDVATALARHDCFGGHLLALLATGNQADQLTQSLTYVEQELAREAGQLRAVVSASVQPLVIMLLGVVIGFILIAVYVPLFSMARLVGP